VAACSQGDGTIRIWVIDVNNCLYSVDSSWTAWSQANWNGAPPLQSIAASVQSHPFGAALWGIGLDGQLYSTFQELIGTSIWTPWASGLGNVIAAPGDLAVLAACEQNDMLVRIDGGVFAGVTDKHSTIRTQLAG
jgi:hypothetical protein